MKESWNSIDFIHKTFCFLFFFNFIIKGVFAVPSKHLCLPEQRDALIMFKNEFKFPKYYYSDRFKMESWRNNSDCCSWDDITCDANFGYVIELNLTESCLIGQLNSKSNLFRLQSLHLLDLSRNYFSGQIPSSLGNFCKLTTLHLSYNYFNGQIPSSLANLSHLKSLNLYGIDLTGEILSDFGRLNELVVLNLGSNKFNGNFPVTLLNLTKLSALDLSFNQLTGTLPPNMTSLSNLEWFSVRFNAFTGTLPSSLFAIPNINSIYADENQLNGILDFGNLSSSLEVLFLGNNKFRGPIPRSIVKLVNLEKLDLSYLNTIDSVDFSILSHFKSLSYLDLSHLNTTTTFNLNEIFSYFKYLDKLDLSGNHVSADIKVSISDHPLMEFLNLSRCSLTRFPEFLRIPYKIGNFDISNNEIKGEVPGWLWSLPNLRYVDLSSNKFIGFERSMNPINSGEIVYLFGANNNFRGNIPSFICGFSSLIILDLSNNKFNGSIPGCLGNFTHLEVLNLSKNRLSGGIPKNFSKSLVSVDLGHTQLVGKLPRSLVLISSLQVLNLSKNRLSGGIPENLSTSLESLDLGHNQLLGKLPRSFVHISSLEVLNVESNKVNDTFPFWLSSLRELKVLVLRTNAFHGPIQKFGFSELRIIDISGNHFSGTLPSDCFVNWTAMFSLGITGDESNKRFMGSAYYDDSMVLMNKGVETELVRVLKIFTAVDFSRNKFEGEIPSSIGLLKELHALNLSNNAFSGHIPSTMANLIEVESLDVSQNKLSGEIPQDLGKLSFLSCMDFSHNQLVGPIPESTQFTTQPCSSFEDNPGLFGPTLDRACGDKHKKTSQQPERPEQGEDEEEVISWIAAAIGVIPGISFGFTMGYILLSNKSKLFVKTFG